MKEELKCYADTNNMDNVYFLGYKGGEELKEEIKKSMFVVVPSEWYENNPLSIIESFVLGKPVVGARIGGIPELVKDNITGLTFKSGDARDLKDKITKLVSSPEEIVRIGKNAREFVEREFNKEIHYQNLIKVYKLAMEKHK